MNKDNPENKREEHEERDVQRAMEFEQELDGADEADALYMMSLYEKEYNDMTLAGVKSRVKR